MTSWLKGEGAQRGRDIDVLNQEVLDQISRHPTFQPRLTKPVLIGQRAPASFATRV